MTDSSPPTVLFPSGAAPVIGTEFVGVANGHLSLGGERVAFFGVNFDQNAVFFPLLVWKKSLPGHVIDPTGCALVDAQLDNLVNAGVRAIRVHGLDCTSQGSIFWPQGPANPPATTRQLDPMGLQALGYLFAGCRKRNIRVVMTLHYLRQLSPCDRPSWPCPTFDELMNNPVRGTKPGLMHPWFWFDSGLQQLQAEFNEQLLGWTNPYTGVALGQDPTLLAVILQNERSIVKDDPYTYSNQPVLQSLWSSAQDAFQRQSGITTATLNKVQWQQCLAAIETGVLSAQAAHVRTLTGALIIGGTYYGDGPYSMLVGPNSAGDVVDFHFYSRYAAPNTNGFWNGLATTDSRTRFAAVAAGCSWAGKPVFATEWGPVGQFNPLSRDPDSERAGLMNTVVDAAITQDLDAMFLYSWGHSPLTDGQYAKHTCYDFRDDAVLLTGFAAHVARFHDLSLRPSTAATIALTAAKLYGTGIGPQYVLPGPYTDPDLYATAANQKVQMVAAEGWSSE